MTIRVLGLDIGLSGAAAVLERGDGDLLGAKGVRLVDVIDLPIYGIDAAKRINGPALQKWLLSHHPDFAYIELVNAMPAIAGADGKRRGMGVSSAFHFGRTAGSCETAVACAGIPVKMVTPQVWKKSFGLRGGIGAKEAARCYCIERLPQAAHLMQLKKHNGRSEAVLIALYGIITLSKEAGNGEAARGAAA
jgi:hypothetical protein